MNLNKTSLMLSMGAFLICAIGINTAQASIRGQVMRDAVEHQRQQQQQTQHQIQDGNRGVVYGNQQDGSMSAQSSDGYSITDKGDVTTGHFPDGRKLVRYKSTGQVLLVYPNGQYADITDRLGDPSLDLLRYQPTPMPGRVPVSPPRSGGKDTNSFKSPSNNYQQQR